MKTFYSTALLLVFYSTMPGLGAMQVVMRSIGLWETQSSDALDSLEYGGGPIWLVIVSLLLWHLAFGRWLGIQKKSSLGATLLVAAPLILGKVLDLVFEGRLWTGSYWAVLSAVLLLALPGVVGVQPAADSP